MKNGSIEFNRRTRMTIYVDAYGELHIPDNAHVAEGQTIGTSKLGGNFSGTGL